MGETKYTLEEIRSIPIFFIVGKGRSGTTLVSNILDGHPNVASATESRFLLLIWQKYKSLKTWKPEMAEEFFSDVLKDYRVKYLWDFREKEFIEQLKSLPSDLKAQDLIKLVYIYRKSSFPKEKIKFIIDKNPRYTIFISKLQEIFSGAKFVRIIRDPRDNVTSHVKFSKKKVSFLAFKWLSYNKHIDQKTKKFPDNFKTLRFEDLVLNKGQFFDEFESFTGINSLIEYEAKRLEFREEIEGKFSDRLKDQHQSSVKPLDPKKIGHHKTKLSPDQIKTIDSICFPYAEEFKYERELKPLKIGFLESLKFKFSYQFHVTSNLFLYNLPFNVIIKLYDFLIKHVLMRKKEKLDTIRQQNG